MTDTGVLGEPHDLVSRGIAMMSSDGNPMSNYLIEPRPTLKRWLAGERIGPLPMRGADQYRGSFRSSSFLRVRKPSSSNYGPAYGGWRLSRRASSL